MRPRWGEITAQTIEKAIRGSLVSGTGEGVLSGISTDSRSIAPGQIFWALQGDTHDGHDFINQALSQGAAGAVVRTSWWHKAAAPLPKSPVMIAVEDCLQALGDLASWWRRQHRAKVIVVTGSSGKTTTKEMISRILGQQGATLKNEGNLNNLIGLPLSLLALREDHDYAVLEMGMNRRGEIGRLTEITGPDLGLITNVGKAHLEGLRTLDGVAKAKTELVAKISPEARMIINGDDEVLMEAASVYGKDLMTFGTGRKNQVRATDIQNHGIRGLSFTLHYKGSTWPMRLRVPGIQNLSNALGACAATLALETVPALIAQGLSDFEGVKGRFSILPLGREGMIIDDTYNANPSSLGAALESLKAILTQDTQIIIGLGEMMELGEATVREHEDAGRKVAALCPSHFLSMGKHGVAMRRGAIQGGMTEGQVAVVESHLQMIRGIVDRMKGKTIVFLKASRKMHFEKIVEGVRQVVSRTESGDGGQFLEWGEPGHEPLTKGSRVHAL